jgi:hypothetical protein
MSLFLADVKDRYCSVHGYVIHQLGVDESLVAALRRQLLTDQA